MIIYTRLPVASDAKSWWNNNEKTTQKQHGLQGKNINNTSYSKSEQYKTKQRVKTGSIF